MAQTPEQKARRAAQRKLAQRIKRGESPLGGEFRQYVERAMGQAPTPPPPVNPSGIETPRPFTTESVEVDYESIAAEEFASGVGHEDDIPFTYRPTATSYPSRLPQNKHRRTTAAGYDNQTQRLAVQFYTDGAVYHYYDVPTWMAREFRLADSPGDYINEELNHHPYERIR